MLSLYSMLGSTIFERAMYFLLFLRVLVRIHVRIYGNTMIIKSKTAVSAFILREAFQNSSATKLSSFKRFFNSNQSISPTTLILPLYNFSSSFYPTTLIHIIKRRRTKPVIFTPTMWLDKKQRNNNQSSYCRKTMVIARIDKQTPSLIGKR